MTNISWSRELLNQLSSLGVKDYVFCSGSRNAPLIQVLDKSEGINKFSFFEERSAAFFALGRIKDLGRPVVVITTSGTAVAELLPACVEAFYSESPLILVTADRPKSYRGTGAPQVIEQVGIFSHYVERTYDLAPKEEIKLDINNKPIHINICFDEPLIDDQLSVLNLSPAEVIKETHLGKEQNISLDQPLVFVSGLDKERAEAVYQKIQTWDVPVYVEGPSHLRLESFFEKQLIKSGEKYLNQLLQQGKIRSVLRIGAVPTARFWRDLELANIPITVVSTWKGLAREVRQISIDDFLVSHWDLKHTELSEIKNEDERRYQQLISLLDKHPHSEPSVVFKISQQIGKDSVFIGNSLPIREWDLAAQWSTQPHRFFANRGANGIDGLVSTFLGTAAQWAVVGDLSALYDLSALWAHSWPSDQKRKLIILNNSGGQIFSRIYKDKVFQNNHSYRFNSWAEMFGVKYLCGVDQLKQAQVATENVILEIPIDQQQSDLFWQEYEQL